MSRLIQSLVCFLLLASARGQLKFIVDDFEGYANGTADLAKNGVFSFGNAGATIVSSGNNSSEINQPDYLGQRALRISKKTAKEFGGWGKGTSCCVQLDVSSDELCFYAKLKGKNTKKVRISIQEDDDGDNIFKKERDDQWTCEYHFKPGEDWQLITLPLKQFADESTGGDGIFNCNYKQGRLLCLIMNFEKQSLLQESESLDIDFICFSKGGLTKRTREGDGCALGLWSAEGNQANFTEIATNFEQMFGKEKKLALIHFFQPFSTDGTTNLSQYPSVERVNKILDQGYTPMITLENHYVNVNSTMKQPNLYSIIEGHMDAFFFKWAGEIKQMKGTVWVRILHEFNGDWYPWCIVNNDRDPSLFVKAYQHIHNLFKKQGTENVKFVWCPNSMSVPQQSWNFIMDAYPGDAYVDILGMDIYNGAGDATLWHSFRRVAIENYFLFTQNLPSKPIVICETASRERSGAEPGPAQTKAEWIRQQSEALQSDMTRVKLLTWFNEKSTFKLNSSSGSKKAFQEYILNAPYFKDGNSSLDALSEN